jgi:hypothetical protein
MTVIITGAAGTIGKAVAAALTTEAIPVRLLDIRPQYQVPANAHAQRVDLRDLTATIQATVGGSVLIHLAGITEEAPFPEVCEHNILGTYHVLEAARRNHIPRVVLASSHHTIGFTPTDQQVTTTSATAPDSFYAVSKSPVKHSDRSTPTNTTSPWSRCASAASTPHPPNPDTPRPGSAPAMASPCYAPPPPSHSPNHSSPCTGPQTTHNTGGPAKAGTNSATTQPTGPTTTRYPAPSPTAGTAAPTPPTPAPSRAATPTQHQPEQRRATATTSRAHGASRYWSTSARPPPRCAPRSVSTTSTSTPTGSRFRGYRRAVSVRSACGSLDFTGA